MKICTTVRIGPAAKTRSCVCVCFVIVARERERSFSARLPGKLDHLYFTSLIPVARNSPAAMRRPLYYTTRIYRMQEDNFCRSL